MIKAFINQDWATPMHNAALSIGKTVAFVYAAGYCFGKALHGLNDRLAKR